MSWLRDAKPKDVARTERGTVSVRFTQTLEVDYDPESGGVDIGVGDDGRAYRGSIGEIDARSARVLREAAEQVGLTVNSNPRSQKSHKRLMK
jgi:hypothetical protein